MLAEDEVEVLRLYKILLEDEGHEVVTAKDGLECLEAYKHALERVVETGVPVFDLVILNHKMPVKTGLEAANEIIELSSTQQILMITAYGGELQTKDNNARVKIIRKPLDVDEFIAVVTKSGKTR